MDKIDKKADKKVVNNIIEKVLVNLRVISTLQEGEKLVYTSSGNFVPQQPSLFNSLMRFVTRDDRWNTLTKLNDLITTAEAMQSVDNGAEKERIQAALEMSVNGLRNLQLTYSGDVLFYQSLEVLIERVHSI